MEGSSSCTDVLETMVADAMMLGDSQMTALAVGSDLINDEILLHERSNGHLTA